MARNTIQASLVFRLERMGGVANLLNLYNQYLGDPGKFGWDLSRYDAVTAANLKQFATSTLTDNSRVVLYAVKGRKVIDDPPQNKAPEKASNVASLDIAGQEWRKTGIGLPAFEVHVTGSKAVHASERTRTYVYRTA